MFGKQWVLYSNRWGVYLGQDDESGVTYWTGLHLVKPELAPTFDDPVDISVLVSGWNCEVPEWEAVEVRTIEDGVTSKSLCVEAGLTRWKTEGKDAPQ